MDRSFSSIGMRPTKNTSVSRSRQSLAGSVFSAASAGRSSNAGIFTREGSGRYSLSSRSNVSHANVVAKSEYNVLESYGFVLPVQVIHLLSFTELSVPVSVNYSQNGWAWLVHGRRLFVWQYCESPVQKAAASGAGQFSTPQRKIGGYCWELTLPHCDIGHKATLVTVFVNEGQQQMASCLAVSPAGDVRYWNSILRDASSVDQSNILEGQEFEQLVALGGCEFILVTTTCSLVRLNLELENGRYIIQPRLIKPPSGFLGSIGKRFASIIIGMHSSQEKENKLVKMTCEKISATEWHVTVLADRWIQRWTLHPDGKNERFLVEDAEIMKKMRDVYHQKLWSTRDVSEIEQWCLDMQPTDRGVIILSAAVNQQRTPQVHYALMTVVFESDNTFVLKETTMMRYQGFYSPERVAEIIDYRFIANRSFAYVYNERQIFPVALSATAPSGGSPVASESVEKIELNSRDGSILMGNCFQNTPLFFSRHDGIVKVSPSDFDPSEMFNSSFSSEVFKPTASVVDASASLQQSIFAPATTNAGNLVLYELDPDELIDSKEQEDDPVHLLKAAFIYHVKRNTVAADEQIQSLMQTVDLRDKLDGVLDRTVMKIALDLADDTPAADPRWEVTDRHALGSSTSLQIIQQLREKNIAYTLFVEFLRNRGLWEQLGAVSNSGEIRPTAQCLSDVGEKIVAAIGLRCLHGGHARLLEEAISSLLRASNRTVPFPNLIPQDLFYAQTSRVDELFQVLAETVDRYVQENTSTIQIQLTLVEVNTIVLSVLQEVLNYRESKSELYTIADELKARYEYVPWTAASGKGGLRDALVHMIGNTLREGVKGTNEPEFRAKHFTHLTELVDYVLDGRKTYLEHIHDQEKYTVLLQQYKAQRSDLICPFLEAEQYEMAAKLAEKYLDFQALVEICDKTNNQERLDEYIERYKEHDFAQFAISWHMRQSKQGDILQRFKNNPSELSRFLVDHPSMAWIQLVFNGELTHATKVLVAMAQREQELLTRKRVILCLAKLCLLAADGETHLAVLQDINNELELIEIQEHIPSEVLEHFGYDTKDVKVLTPDEMVNLFISDVNRDSSEKEFHHALSLLPHVDDPEEMRHRIWCAAIQRDSWEDYNKSSPLDSMQNMLFFKLIDLCFITDGGQVENFLPPLENFLDAPELGELTDSKAFQYLIKLGYEHIHESYKVK